MKKKAQKRINALVDIIAQQQNDYEMLEEYAVHMGDVVQALTESQDAFEEDLLREAVIKKAEDESSAQNSDTNDKSSFSNTSIGDLIERCGEESSANGEHDRYMQLVQARREGGLASGKALTEHIIAKTEKASRSLSDAISDIANHYEPGNVYLSGDGKILGYGPGLARAVIQICELAWLLKLELPGLIERVLSGNSPYGEEEW